MNLYLECYPDETLAQSVGVGPRDIIHCHGKGGVAKHLAKRLAVIGLVDEDPGSAEPANLRGFAERSCQYDIRFKVDAQRGNRLLVICPRLEPWLLKTAKSAGVEMAEFGLSDRLRDLDAEINQRLGNLSRLLKRLAELKSPRLGHLQNLLTH